MMATDPGRGPAVAGLRVAMHTAAAGGDSEQEQLFSDALQSESQVLSNCAVVKEPGRMSQGRGPAAG